MLSKRLQTALDLLPVCRCIADVGCDHGLLTLALLTRGKCEHVVASDISAPSLGKAKTRLAQANLAGRASFFCCDGLSFAEPAQAAAILGMGGRTILEILRAQNKAALSMQCLVLQPASHREALYQALPELGLCVEEECIVRENGRFFPLIRLVPGCQAPLSGAAAEIGPLNSARRDPVTLSYTKWLCGVLQRALMHKGGGENQQKAAARLQALTAYLEEE